MYIKLKEKDIYMLRIGNTPITNVENESNARRPRKPLNKDNSDVFANKDTFEAILKKIAEEQGCSTDDMFTKSKNKK